MLTASVLVPPPPAPNTQQITPAIPEPPTESSAHGAIQAASDDAETCGRVPAYYTEALIDAERLLKYAAETGMEIDDCVRNHVLQARTACNQSRWTEQTAANLLSALTTLTGHLRPVTASTLAASMGDTRAAVNTYLRVALCLAIVIVPFSVASFMTTAISNAIKQDITVANDLAVRLRSQLGPLPPVPASTAAGAAAAVPSASSTPSVPSPAPASPGAASAAASATQLSGASTSGLNNSDDIISELQQFASTTRAIDSRSRQLNVLVFGAERDPFSSIRKNPQALHDKFQLPSGLPDLAVAANQRTLVYQDVRYFAQNVLDDVSFFYGAMGTCILPVLYALLGTCAYLLRNFEQQLRTRTYSPTRANSARFLIAAIGGAVVGLFKSFSISDGATISPLAIAFLVGYAVDVFFSFLEGLIQSFTRNAPAAPPPPPMKAA